GVTDRHELDVLLAEHPLQIELAAATDSNRTHHDAFAGSRRTIAAQSPGGDDGRRQAKGSRRGRGLFQALPPVQLLRTWSGSRHGFVSVVNGLKKPKS